MKQDATLLDPGVTPLLYEDEKLTQTKTNMPLTASTSCDQWTAGKHTEKKFIRDKNASAVCFYRTNKTNLFKILHRWHPASPHSSDYICQRWTVHVATLCDRYPFRWTSSTYPTVSQQLYTNSSSESFCVFSMFSLFLVFLCYFSVLCR